MARSAVRIQVVEFGVLVGLALLVGRAAQVQILQGRRWAEEAQAQRTERIVLQARRGTLYDRHGTPLAVTQETYHVGIAPNELRDRTADGALSSRRLGLTAHAWQEALRRRYAYFAGPYSALEIQSLRSVRGVHLEPVLNRFYPDPAVARATIGRLGDDGLAASGLERTLDSLLAGRAGAAVVLKDRAGREYESPARVIAPPVPGLDVVLTLDAELQEIAQRALDDALRRMDADGGDVVMLDPGTGDVLALASRQRDGSARPSAFTDTFEPGSLAKIFAVAALLSLRRVSPMDRVSGEGGKWHVLGRTITDDDPQPSLTMADAIRVSSNIAIAKFAARLSPEEQYAMLRAFRCGARHWNRSGAHQLSRRGEDRDGAPCRERPLRGRRIHGLVRRAVPRRSAAARAGREDRQPAQGELLRRSDGGAGHALDARTSARGSHGGARPGPAIHRRAPRRGGARG